MEAKLTGSRNWEVKSSGASTRVAENGSMRVVVGALYESNVAPAILPETQSLLSRETHSVVVGMTFVFSSANRYV